MNILGFYKGIKVGLKKFAQTGVGAVLGGTRELEALHKSGNKFSVELSIGAFQLQGNWYAVGSMRDISARKDYERRLTELATTDGLTALFNRRYFMDQADVQLMQAIRYNKPFSLIMLDLDHFKRVNDTYGHDTGDKVLRKVADTMKECLRETDILGRIGGEEFAVSMPETDIELSLQAAERLRIRFTQVKIEAQGETIGFTASIGISHLTFSETSLSEMIKKADSALYEAKKSGRNRVVANKT